MFLSTSTLHKIMVIGGVDLNEKKDLDIHVGRQIKLARKAAGYTQEKFAEMIGMGPKNVSAIERGAVGVSLFMLKRICGMLAVSSDSLIMDKADDKDAAAEKNLAKINVLVERLKRLPQQQLDIVISIINKVLEAYNLSDKIITIEQKRRPGYKTKNLTDSVAESQKKSQD